MERRLLIRGEDNLKPEDFLPEEDFVIYLKTSNRPRFEVSSDMLLRVQRGSYAVQVVKRVVDCVGGFDVYECPYEEEKGEKVIYGDFIGRSGDKGDLENVFEELNDLRRKG